MGLDTVSYARIVALPADWTPPPVNAQDALYDQGIARAYTYDCFPRAMDGLEGGHDPDLTLLISQRFGYLGSRWYQASGAGPATHSSYGEHSAYRSALMTAYWGGTENFGWSGASYDPDKPFIDLIYFADNEGLLGPDACARLAADYAANDVALLAVVAEDFYVRLHEQWRAAVNHSASGGCIRFQ